MNSESKPTKDDVIKLEKSYWDAMKSKDGSKTARLSGATSVVTGPRGVTTIEKDKMSQMTETDDWQLESYSFEDVEVVVPSADVAIIGYTARQKVTTDGKTQELKAADSSTWLRGPAGWECHAHSETVLAQS